MRIGGGASVAVVVAILAIFVGILGANGGVGSMAQCGPGTC